MTKCQDVATCSSHKDSVQLPGSCGTGHVDVPVSLVHKVQGDPKTSMRATNPRTSMCAINQPHDASVLAQAHHGHPIHHRPASGVVQLQEFCCKQPEN